MPKLKKPIELSNEELIVRAMNYFKRDNKKTNKDINPVFFSIQLRGYKSHSNAEYYINLVDQMSIRKLWIEYEEIIKIIKFYENNKYLYKK